MKSCQLRLCRVSWPPTNQKCVPPSFPPLAHPPHLHFQLRAIQYQAKQALSKVNSTMNTFSKINRLPPEILAMIPSFLDSYKDLINTTHVCRYWRNTLIASPPLWSRLDNNMMHEDLVSTFMNRCGDTPLEVTFSTLLGSKNTPFLEEAIRRSSQIHKVRFPSLPWWHIAAFSDAFDAPLPLLRQLDVHAGYDGVDVPPFQRPFLVGATNLVSLTLRDRNKVSGTLLPFVFPTITYLELQFDRPRVALVSELLDLFRNSPLIEELHIKADVVLDAPDEHSAFPSRFKQVDLLHLRDIRLDWNTPRPQYTLLSHINYPPTCFVSMRVLSNCNVNKPPQNVFPTSWDAFFLADLFSITLRIKREQQSTECAVMVEKLNGASISVSHFQDTGGYVFVDDDGTLSRNPARDRDDDHVISLAITFVMGLPLHLIREFVLEDLAGNEMANPESFKIPPALVELICSRLPNLTSLTLNRSSLSELYNILTPSTPPSIDTFGDSDASKWALPCPTLKVLKVRHPIWDPVRHCRETTALVKARKTEGIPLDRLFFCSPDVPPEMSQGMSLYVGSVDIQRCGECEGEAC